MAISNYFQFNVFTQPDPNNPGKTNIQIQPGVHGLFSGGVIMDLVIGIDSITAQALGVQANTPISIKGLFDTGCTITSIDKSIVSNLGLAVRGYTKTYTANGPVSVSQHLISLAFPGTQLKGRLVFPVQAVDLSGQPFGVLIGRDLMSNWTITYNGPAGFVSIAD